MKKKEGDAEGEPAEDKEAAEETAKTDAEVTA